MAGEHVHCVPPHSLSSLHLCWRVSSVRVVCECSAVQPSVECTVAVGSLSESDGGTSTLSPHCSSDTDNNHEGTHNNTKKGDDHMTIGNANTATALLGRVCAWLPSPFLPWRRAPARARRAETFSRSGEEGQRSRWLRVDVAVVWISMSEYVVCAHRLRGGERE